jgi:hypothetical protein
MYLLLLCAIGMSLSVGGDIFCKHATTATGYMFYVYSIAATITWGVQPFIWIQIYRMKSITEMMVLYNPIQLLVLALAGILLFHEPLTWKLVLSYILLVICFYLQS